MANWTPRAPRNLSATSNPAASAPLLLELRNRCARRFSAAVFTKALPLVFARKSVRISTPRRLPRVPFAFPHGVGLPLPPPFCSSLLFPGLPGYVPPWIAQLAPPSPLPRSLTPMFVRCNLGISPTLLPPTITPSSLG